jgi:ATP-binding cassette subfamily B protein
MQTNKAGSQFMDILLSYRKYYIAAIVFALLSLLCGFTIPVVIKNIIDIILTDQSQSVSGIVWWLIGLIGGSETLARNLWLAMLAVIALYAVSAILMYFTILLTGLASEYIVKEIRDQLYRKFQRLSYTFFSAEKTGDLIQRSTSDVVATHAFLSNQLVEIGRTIIMIIVLIPYMFFISVKMAAVSLALSPLMAVVSIHYFRLLIRRSKIIEVNESEMTSTIQENLAGFRVVRAFSRHAYEQEKFKKRSRDYFDSVLRRIDTFARFFGLATTLAFGQLVIVLILGSWMVIHQWVSIGTLVAFFAYAGAIAFTLRGLGIMLGETGGAVVAIGRIDKILSMPAASATNEDPVDINLRGEIRFQNVSFGYQETNNVLDNISFHIKPGERVAIVGPSGSGKSTMIELLLKNCDHKSGTILLDGMDLKDLVPATVRSQIGTSLQDVFLFSDTVRSNIKIAKVTATDGEVKTASETAKIHDTIQEFPEKYDTFIGEKGVDLSGGERQRMVLARTFVRQPPILILDDSLSAVDVHTEREILRELNKKHEDVTVIIITNRLACCLNADRVFVLEDGRLAMTGSHDELIREEGFYKRLWGIQEEIDQIADKTTKGP